MEILIKEMSIRRNEVEKFIVAVQQIFSPIELNKETRITIDCDLGRPSINKKFIKAE